MRERKLVLRWAVPTIIHLDAEQSDNIRIVSIKEDK